MRGWDQVGWSGEAAISARDLACRRGGRLLFAHLGFALVAGEAALVSGPNGVGKSSLLRLLAGLLPPFAGTLEATGAMSLADDRLALDGDRTLADALSFWARIDRRDGSALRSALSALALDTLAQVPVRMLSTGQRRRAALARTLASGAPIWLLDEPGNGLDNHSAALLGSAVERHRTAGGIVVAASHQSLPWAPDIAFAITAPAEDSA